MKALRLSSVKTLAKNNKIIVPLTDEGKSLKRLGEERNIRIDEFVEWRVAEGESILGSIVKNGKKVEYTNPAGKLLKWAEQGARDIDNSIMAAKKVDPLDPNNVGRITEGKVGQFVKSKKRLTGFGQKIDPLLI